MMILIVLFGHEDDCKLKNSKEVRRFHDLDSQTYGRKRPDEKEWKGFPVGFGGSVTILVASVVWVALDWPWPILPKDQAGLYGPLRSSVWSACSADVHWDNEVICLSVYGARSHPWPGVSNSGSDRLHSWIFIRRRGGDVWLWRTEDSTV